MASKNPTNKKENEYFQIALVSFLILASLIYFGNFWLKALKKEQTTESVLSAQEVSTSDTAQTPSAIVSNKTEKPVVELFVMSFCPYGNLAEDTMYPIVKLLADKIDLHIRYIVNKRGEEIASLHGKPEVLQNQRELCVNNLYGKDSLWEFVTKVNSDCGTNTYDSTGKLIKEAGSCWADVAVDLGISIDNLNNCVLAQGDGLLSQQVEFTKSKNVSGSPTLFVNGYKDQSVIYKYGDSESYKNLVCSAFINPPNECSTELSVSSSNTGGSCN